MANCSPARLKSIQNWERRKRPNMAPDHSLAGSFRKRRTMSQRPITPPDVRTGRRRRGKELDRNKRPRLCVSPVYGPAGPKTFEVTKNQMVIGRGGRSYWVDLKLETLPDVSREHCRIRRDAETGRFTIEDVSQFGTAVTASPSARTPPPNFRPARPSASPASSISNGRRREDKSDTG